MPCTGFACKIATIKSAFVRRDVGGYSSVLDSQFVFRFIPDLSGYSDSTIRPQEINFADHLFATGSSDGLQVPAARIALAIDTVNTQTDVRPGHAGWIRVYAQTHLTLFFTDGDSAAVNSPAYFFFRQSSPGEWKLAEWLDVPSITSPGRRKLGPQDRSAHKGISWGDLRKIYR